MSLSGQSRRLSDVGMSVSSPPTTDVSLRRSEPTLWARTDMTATHTVISKGDLIGIVFHVSLPTARCRV